MEEFLHYPLCKIGKILWQANVFTSFLEYLAQQNRRVSQGVKGAWEGFPGFLL